MISVIIPTLNEEENIGRLLQFFDEHPRKSELEIIVVDGGSKDQTCSIAQSYPCHLLRSAKQSRASQMNLGATHAKGDVLYFVHADTLPPGSFVDDIYSAHLTGYKIGCYRFKFRNKPTPLLHINDFFTRLPFMWCRGGDQTLFVDNGLFSSLGGFNEDFVIMEDYELLERTKKYSKFIIMPKSVEVSSRKYEHNSYMKVQLTNLKAMKMYRNGVNPARIRNYYTNKLVS